MDIESGKEQPPGAQPPTHGYIQGKGDLDTRVLHVLVALISRPLSSQSSSDVDPIWNSNQEYLIAVRTDGPCAGLWEFPGGKVEADESLYDALCREIKEEVGVTVSAAAPLLTIDTPSVKKEKNIIIRLHVWNVTQWSGEPYGAEGQPVKWSRITWDDRQHFLPPNRHMFTALRLGEALSLLNVNNLQANEIAESLNKWQQLNPEITEKCVIRLRANGLDAQDYAKLLGHTLAQYDSALPHLLIDMLPDLDLGTLDAVLKHPAVIGVHFPSWWQKTELESQRKKILKDLQAEYPSLLKGASCHSEQELIWACKDEQGLKAEFYCLSPVKTPNSHPITEQPLGWTAWQHINQKVENPGYAMGGLTLADGVELKARGSFGVAGVSEFQPSTQFSEQMQALAHQLEIRS